MNNEMNQRFCHKCGAQLAPSDSFCIKCGESCSAQKDPEPMSFSQPSFYAMPPKSVKGKINIKKTLLSNIIPLACFAIGIFLIFMGLDVYIPSGYISSYTMTEYVGGDAYNYIIEANIRGGEIAAAEISGVILLCSGLIIACMAALKTKIIKND